MRLMIQSNRTEDTKEWDQSYKQWYQRWKTIKSPMGHPKEDEWVIWKNLKIFKILFLILLSQ